MTREQFISNLSNWNSYLPALWEALENTEGDVIELGVGDGSTVKLDTYCVHNRRTLCSYESNIDWYDKFRTDYSHDITYVGANWQIMQERHRSNVGVLFSDEAPGEMRKYNISMFCNIAQVIVAHDSEKESDHGYKFSLVKPLFKYVKETEFNGTGTAIFSNFLDVTKFNL
jgi:hypothetical protein